MNNTLHKQQLCNDLVRTRRRLKAIEQSMAEQDKQIEQLVYALTMMNAIVKHQIPFREEIITTTNNILKQYQ